MPECYPDWCNQPDLLPSHLIDFLINNNNYGAFTILTILRHVLGQMNFHDYDGRSFERGIIKYERAHRIRLEGRSKEVEDLRKCVEGEDVQGKAGKCSR